MSPRTASSPYLPAGLSAQPLERLHIYLDNPRVIHTQRFAELKESIVADPTFLLQRPLLVSDGPKFKMQGFIYAGNHRAHALQELYDGGWSCDAFPRGTVPVDVSDTDEKTCLERLYRDNNEWADWDTAELATQVQTLQTAGANVHLLGFDPDEVNALLESTSTQAVSPSTLPSSPDGLANGEGGDGEGDADDEGGPPAIDHIAGALDTPVAAGIRKLELQYELDQFREVNDLLDWLREFYQVETNAEAIQAALEEFGPLHSDAQAG